MDLVRTQSVAEDALLIALEDADTTDGQHYARLGRIGELLTPLVPQERATLALALTTVLAMTTGVDQPKPVFAASLFFTD